MYGSRVPVLQRLRLDHAAALLTFEIENRTYFAASVPDRGDDYFANFEARHRKLIAEQDAGLHHFHVLVDAGRQVSGRINLADVNDSTAELGFRIAEAATRTGLASASVEQVCGLAASTYGLGLLRASATIDNAPRVRS